MKSFFGIFSWRKSNTLIFVTLSSLVLLGCSNYQEVALDGAKMVDKRQFKSALLHYDDKLKDSRLDRLLYLLDTGTILHFDSQHEASNRNFMEAEVLIQQLDRISITEETASMLSNDEAKPYKGEDHEKIMISVYIIMNFLALQQWESAQIEVRKIQEKLEVLRRNEGQKYTEDPFASYLSGLVFEAQGQFDSAYIDYKKVHELQPDFPLVKDDLLRLSQRLNFTDDYDQWVKAFGKHSLNKEAEKNSEEVIFIYAAGKSPRKLAHQSSANSVMIGYMVAGGIGAAAGGDFLIPIPRYKNRPYSIQQIRVSQNAQEIAQSAEVENLEEVAQQSLKDRVGREVAKSLLRLASKAKMQDEIRKSLGGTAGLIAGIGFSLSQKADTRSWLTLPASWQIAKARLPFGSHELKVTYVDQFARAANSEMVKVEVKHCQKTFLFLRSTL